MQNVPTPANWPFPPISGPVPWTRAQELDYQRQQRQQEAQDRANLPAAPF